MLHIVVGGHQQWIVYSSAAPRVWCVCGGWLRCVGAFFVTLSMVTHLRYCPTLIELPTVGRGTYAASSALGSCGDNTTPSQQRMLEKSFSSGVQNSTLHSRSLEKKRREGEKEWLVNTHTERHARVRTRTLSCIRPHHVVKMNRPLVDIRRWKTHEGRETKKERCRLIVYLGHCSESSERSPSDKVHHIRVQHHINPTRIDVYLDLLFFC